MVFLSRPPVSRTQPSLGQSPSQPSTPMPPCVISDASQRRSSLAPHGVASENLVCHIIHDIRIVSNDPKASSLSARKPVTLGRCWHIVWWYCRHNWTSHTGIVIGTVASGP